MDDVHARCSKTFKGLSIIGPKASFPIYVSNVQKIAYIMFESHGQLEINAFQPQK